MQTPLLLLLPLLLAGYAYADWSDSFSSLYTARHKRAINYYEDITEPIHVRAKRAILAAIGYRSKCTFGWTGQFCENPVCIDRRQLPERETDLEKEVDLIHLQQDCAGEYYIPFDSLSAYLFITVTTDAGSPRIVLSDPRGNELGAIQSDGRVGYAEGRYEGLPGDYLLTIDNGGVPTPNCILHVKAGSPLTFDTGFVPGPQVDNPPFGESGEEGVPNYFIAHPFGLPGAGEVRTVSIRIDSSPLPAYRSTLTKRFGCAYEYYAGEFTCQLNRQYTQTIEGVDDRGYTFRRTRAIGCYPNRGSGTTTQPPVPITDCLNNGTFYNPGSTPQDATCLCDELFVGRQCEQVNCMNGGLRIPNDIEKCDCNPGYRGNSCDQVSCNPNVGSYLTDRKTLIVVVRQTRNMAQYIGQISSAIASEYLNHLFDGEDAYDSFLLITVTNGVISPGKTYGPNDFTSFLLALQLLQVSFTTGDCQDDVLAAAALVYEKEVNPQSPVFVFTDVPVTDQDLSNLQEIARGNAVLKFHFHTFFAPPAAACPPDKNDFHYTIYRDLAQYTGGLFHQPTTGNNFGNIFSLSMQTTVYHQNFVEILDLDRCDTNRRALIVDRSSEWITIAGTGSNLQLSYTDPDWNTVNLDPAFTYDGSYFWEITTPQAGEYVYSLHSTDPTTACALRIYSMSEFDLFFGITEAVDIDVGFAEPVVGIPAHLVAQLNGFGNGYIQDPFRVFTEVQITAPGPDGGNPAPIYYSNGIARSDCGFHFYFGVANFCRYPEQRFYVTVFADDVRGFPVQRTSVGFCAPPPAPPTRAPEGACDHGGVPVAGNGSACICPSHYAGFRCEEIECQNGGTPTREGRCACGYGHTGTFCEISTCPSQNDQDDLTFDHKTLTVIVSARASTRGIVTSLYNKALEFARDLRSNSPVWFDFLNVVVVSTEANYAYVGKTPLEFVENLKFVNDNFDDFVSQTDTGCPIALVEAMIKAVSLSTPNSYIFVFADSQAKPSADPAASLRMFDDIAEQQTVVTFFGTDPTMCGAQTFGTFEVGLADFTGGDVFYTSQIDKVFYYITSFYSSGLVTTRRSTACVDTPLQFYFPVDVQSRAFTLSVTNGAAITVTTPNGDDSGLYFSSIIDDDNVKIYQYITNCPQRWDAQDVYCHRFVADELTWIAAHYECYRSDATAHMVDILSDDKYQFVKTEGGGYNVWLSLTKNGSTQNDYYWTYPNVQDPIPLDPALAHWAPNQDFSNQDLRGVYMNTQDGLWYMENINAAHFFICQKHRYGQGFEPTTMESLIPPGYWQVSVTGNQPNCTAQIRIQSELQVFFGFTTDEHADTVTLEANANSSTNFVVARGSGLSPFPAQDLMTTEGRIDYVTIGMEGLSIYPLTVDPRDDCTYNAVSTPFRCPNQGALLSNIQLKFEGFDQYGWPFTRYKESRCVQNLARCKNGGFAFNGACVCPEHFAGRSCENIICLNNGVATSAGTCSCPAFYTGQFCELPICDPAYPPILIESRHTLVIAIETSQTMDYNNFEISLVLQNALTTIVNAHPGYYTNFMLYPFDSQMNKQNWFAPVITNDVSQIWTTFNNWDLDSCIQPCPDETICGRPITQLLIDILKRPELEQPNSHIIVITRSAFSDYEMFPELQEYIASAKPKIEFVLAGITSPCSYPWDDPSNIIMQTAATMSDGGIYPFSSPLDIGNKFLAIFVPTLYESQYIAEDIGRTVQCRNSEYVFQVDHSTKQLAVEYFSSDPASIYLIRPDGTNYSLPADPSTTVISNPNTYVGVFNVNTALPPGTYILRGISPAASYCTALVRASSDIILTPAYSLVHDNFGGATQDDGHFQPQRGGLNVLTVHAEGLDNGNLEYVQLLDRFGRTTYTAHMRRRADDCTYQFYADHPFECPGRGLPFEVIIYGRDNQGQLFHRNYNTQCVDSRLPPPPPAPTCDLLSKKIDFVFLVDSSSSVSDDTFAKMISFVGRIAVKYTNQLPYAQFAVTTMSNVPAAGGQISFVDYNADPSAFLTKLNALTRDGGVGQDLTAAINYVKLNYLSAGHGFRPDPSIKHNLVYVTASPTPTDADPGNQVDGLKRDGLIGFTVVAPFLTNLTAPSDLLLSLGGLECGYYPQTDGELIISAVNFINGITCRTARVCGV